MGAPAPVDVEALVPTSETTFPRLLAQQAERTPDGVALQEKRYGIWQQMTWAEYHTRVRDFAHGLAALGVTAGEVVAVIGDNRPEWLITELAAQHLGACVVGVYPTSVGEEVAHVLNTGRVRVVVAEDQEQVDKVVELWDGLEQAESLVCYDPRGLEQYDHPYLRAFGDVEELGRVWGADRPGWLDGQRDSGVSSDVAVVCTTSGTTGMPKLAMLSHRNLVFMGRSLMAIDPLGARDRHVSVLPLAWIGEQMIAVACGLQAGFTTSFAEEASTARADLREIGPSVMFGPPRIWEDMVSGVQVRLGDAGWAKRESFDVAFGLGEKVADLEMRGEKPGAGLRVAAAAAEGLVLRRVREQLGLSRLRRCYTGGAPLGPDVFRFFHAIGVNLKQIYGQTEIGGIAVTHRDGDVLPNTVGLPTPGTELRISPGGQILLRSPAVFVGYYGDSLASELAVDPEGWLQTGDAGFLEDGSGHLVVIDRAKEVIQGPDGRHFSPAFIETKLKFSQYLEEAVVFGGAESSQITAMLVIDPQAVGSWAERHRVGYTTYTDLAQKPEVYELVAGQVKDANDQLPENLRVRRFVLSHKQLDPDDDEITRTRKVRRMVIVRHYQPIIEALQGDADSVTIRTRIAYQDGSSVERDVSLAIQSMADFVGDQPSPRGRPGRRSVGGR
ncbi:MAG TPA: AMP-binding protein [Dermatophilaceae bacterium]|nr:AMP-binding protein [Dermatophilaceae bacterium]